MNVKFGLVASNAGVIVWESGNLIIGEKDDTYTHNRNTNKKLFNVIPHTPCPCKEPQYLLNKRIKHLIRTQENT